MNKATENQTEKQSDIRAALEALDRLLGEADGAEKKALLELLLEATKYD